MSGERTGELDALEPSEGWGPWPRFAPLAVLAVMLGMRMLISGVPWGSALAYAAWGYGPLAVAAALHLAALRFPARYAIDGAAWALTILAGGMVIALVVAGGH